MVSTTAATRGDEAGPSGSTNRSAMASTVVGGSPGAASGWPGMRMKVTERGAGSSASPDTAEGCRFATRRPFQSFLGGAKDLASASIGSTESLRVGRPSNCCGGIPNQSPQLAERNAKFPSGAIVQMGIGVVSSFASGRTLVERDGCAS